MKERDLYPVDAAAGVLMLKVGKDVKPIGGGNGNGSKRISPLLRKWPSIWTPVKGF